MTTVTSFEPPREAARLVASRRGASLRAMFPGTRSGVPTMTAESPAFTRRPVQAESAADGATTDNDQKDPAPQPGPPLPRRLGLAAPPAEGRAPHAHRERFRLLVAMLVAALVSGGATLSFLEIRHAASGNRHAAASTSLPAVAAAPQRIDGNSSGSPSAPLAANEAGANEAAATEAAATEAVASRQAPRGGHSTAKTPMSTPASQRAVPSFALDGTGEIIGLGQQCLDNNSSVTTNGNPIQLWVCDETAAQVWTVAHDQFSVQGKCMATSGTAVVLWDCNGSASQVWLAGSTDGTVRNPASGMCLTAIAVFTKLVLAACSGATGQTWRRP